MQIKLTKLERETIITFNEAEDFAIVFTCHEPLKRRLAILATKRPKEIHLLRSTPHGSVEYRMPKDCVRINMPREISDEQRVKLAAQAKERFGKG